ncbi:hypothetical protein AsAng_0036290 [Aureispira anguillae]|uniref:Uncharacterized protein n=1 Tax=Aureispira anguillae TaxID=2864201 RepID=A0A915YH34_9BACT|nr:hypothetical protein AsAng_0036290 [Aureispira anguillae]
MKVEAPTIIYRLLKNRIKEKYLGHHLVSNLEGKEFDERGIYSKDNH